MNVKPTVAMETKTVFLTRAFVRWLHVLEPEVAPYSAQVGVRFKGGVMGGVMGGVVGGVVSSTQVCIVSSNRIRT